MGFKPILKFGEFWALFEPFFQPYGKKTKSAQGQLKTRSNQKVEENKPALKLNFLSKTNWADPDFEVEYLTEP